jgi:hypothetical protein
MKDFFKFLIAVFFIVFILNIFFGGDSSTATKTESVSISDTQFSAYTMAVKFIERDLKAPSTAKFADYGYGDDPADVSSIGGETYRVKIWVDAQNSFGAMLRNKYQLDLKKKEGKMWELIDIKRLN